MICIMYVDWHLHFDEKDIFLLFSPMINTVNNGIADIQLNLRKPVIADPGLA